MYKIFNYINGVYCELILVEWIDNYNFSEGIVYGKIVNSFKEDIEKVY